MLVTVQLDETNLYPQSKIYDASGVLQATVNPVHVADGLYTDNTYQPSVVGTYTVSTIVYTDSGFTTESTLYSRGSQTTTVYNEDAFKQDVATISSQVVSDMQTVANDFKADTTGLSTHTTSDVVTAMQVVADDFKASAADVADAVWDEATADHVTADTFGKQLGDLESVAGSGGIEYTIAINDGSNPAVAVPVWITTDSAGTNVIAGTKNTDGNGEVTFYLQAGTYYAWASDDNVNFVNPTQITVA